MDDIRVNRRRLRLTQRDLANEIGVSIATVYRWEAGISAPNNRHRRHLSDFLRMKPSENHPLILHLLDSDIPTAIMDMRAAYFAANSEFLELVKIDKQDILGRNLFDVFPEATEAARIERNIGFEGLEATNIMGFDASASLCTLMECTMKHSFEVVRQVSFAGVIVHQIHRRE